MKTLQAITNQSNNAPINMIITNDELDVFNNAHILHRYEDEKISKAKFKTLKALNNKIQSFHDTSVQLTITQVIIMLTDMIIANNNDYNINNQHFGAKPSDMLAKLRGYLFSYNANSKWHSYMMTSNELLTWLLDWNRTRWFHVDDLTIDDFSFIMKELDDLIPKPIMNTGKPFNPFFNNRVFIGISSEYIIAKLHTKYNWSNNKIKQLLYDSYSYDTKNGYSISNVKSHVLETSNNPEDYLYLYNHMSSNPTKILLYEPVMKALNDNKFLFAKALSINTDNMNELINSNADSQCDYIDFLLLECAVNAARTIKTYDEHTAFNEINDNMFSAFIKLVLTNCTDMSQWALALKIINVIINIPGYSDYTEYDDSIIAADREHAGIMKTIKTNGLADIVRDYPDEFIQQYIRANIDYSGLHIIGDD